jgi:hypothetical protein
MGTVIKYLSFMLLLIALLGTKAEANTVTAASCKTSDVQKAIDSAAGGDTVLIPAGNCTWTSGVTISGKGVSVQGAGSGRIIAINQDALSIATGTLSITIQAARVDGTYPLGPVVGQTLRVFQLPNRQNWMQGTVTSFDSSTGALVMNITSTSGTAANTLQGHWCIATVPQTVISNNATGATPMFLVAEDTAHHTEISGIKFLQGTTIQAGAYDVGIQFTSGGQAVLIHDCWMESGAGSAQIEAQVNRGVVWNCSFDSTPFAQGGNNNSALNVVPPPGGQLSVISWTTPSTWGAADTTGQGNFYFETNDIHGYLVAAGTDDGGRLVYRYNFMDNSGFAVHGADSSPYGNRYFDFSNNLGVFNHTNGQVLNMQNWILIRGGTMLVHDNVLPNLLSQDYGQKANLVMAVWNLQWNINHNACWGAGFTTPGQYHHVPRQVGFGYVTGTGTANYPPDGVSNSSTDFYTYVGDSEPVYIWNNTGDHGGGGNNYSLSDGAGIGGSCTNADSVVNYVVLNRDIFVSAKPGYTPYTYPHPLAHGSGSTGLGSGPSAPKNLTATVQ